MNIGLESGAAIGARVPFGVMAGLVPAIHVFLAEGHKKDVDARDKRGHDGAEVIRFHRTSL